MNPSGLPQGLTPSWFSVHLSEWMARASVSSSKGIDIHSKDSEDVLNEWMNGLSE